MCLEKKCSDYMKEALDLRGDLYGITFFRTRDPTNTEDIVQETYLRFHKRLSKNDFQIDGGLLPYLLKVAKNVGIDMASKNKLKLQRLYDNISVSSGGPRSSRKEDLEYLKDRLGEAQFQVLNQLVPMSEVERDTLSSICFMSEKKFNQAKARLSIISETYHDGEKVVLPPGIGGASFDPFRIRFKKNRFNGRPLEYFQNHSDFYGGFSRLELSKVDQTLYNALRGEGTLERAIPEDGRLGKKGLSYNESKAILSAYEPSNASARAASRCTGHNSHLIADHWREHGLEVRNKNELLGRERKEIIDSHKKYGGTVSHASKELGYSRKKISDLWREVGLCIDKNRGLRVMNNL
jgi:DNA-directed RNA polymerase specialized sigma24 family protein